MQRSRDSRTPLTPRPEGVLVATRPHACDARAGPCPSTRGRIGAVLFWFAGAAFAHSWDDPLKPFDASKRLSDRMDITWQIVDKPAAACEREARRRHPEFKGYGYQPDACAFWDERAKKCLIITGRKPTMHDLGHEMRHCFQGHWH